MLTPHWCSFFWFVFPPLQNLTIYWYVVFCCFKDVNHCYFSIVFLNYSWSVIMRKESCMWISFPSVLYFMWIYVLSRRGFSAVCNGWGRGSLSMFTGFCSKFSFQTKWTVWDYISFFVLCFSPIAVKLFCVCLLLHFVYCLVCRLNWKWLQHERAPVNYRSCLK